MANFNFKKSAKVYLYNKTTATYHRLDVTEEISFSQTFTDKTYPQKTLHHQYKLHEASNIKKANPANFEFTIPALTEDTLAVVFNYLVDFKSTSEYTLDTFTLYIVGSDTNVYKLQNCVITNGTFLIEKLENLKLTIAGEATQLVYHKGSDATVPRAILEAAISDSEYASRARTAQKVDYLEVKTPSGTNIGDGVFKVSVELQNEIKWNPYETVNKALDVTNAATSMYPSSFTLQKRILSGSIGAYVIGTSDSAYIGHTNVGEWKTAQTLVIKAGVSDVLGFQFNLLNCTYTNRLNIDDVFTQQYDWKMNDNPTDLGDGSNTARSYITFNNI